MITQETFVDTINQMVREAEFLHDAKNRTPYKRKANVYRPNLPDKRGSQRLRLSDDAGEYIFHDGRIVQASFRFATVYFGCDEKGRSKVAFAVRDFMPYRQMVEISLDATGYRVVHMMYDARSKAVFRYDGASTWSRVMRWNKDYEVSDVCDVVDVPRAVRQYLLHAAEGNVTPLNHQNIKVIRDAFMTFAPTAPVLVRAC